MYTHFKEELSWQEKIILKKYDIQYNLNQVKSGASVFINSAFNYYNHLEKKVKYYSEKNITKDLDMLIKQANQLGGIATESLGKILEELEYQVGYNIKLKKTTNNRYS